MSLLLLILISWTVFLVESHSNGYNVESTEGGPLMQRAWDNTDDEDPADTLHQMESKEIFRWKLILNSVSCTITVPPKK